VSLGITYTGGYDEGISRGCSILGLFGGFGTLFVGFDALGEGEWLIDYNPFKLCLENLEAFLD
jgi:hypothetical protein